MSEAIEVLRSPLLAGPSADCLQQPLRTSFAHGFLGRRGGVSRGLHGGLNVGLGSGDDRAAITENRARAAAAVLPAAKLVTAHQAHSAEAVIVEVAWGDEDRPRADALVTDRPGLLLGILTADCAPVLLTDPAAGVVAAAHAGWKGALGGVIEATLAAMERLGAERRRIAAAVGPCIAQQSYEVDDAFESRFVDAEPANARFFRAGKPGHAWFDLAGFVVSRLLQAGVGEAASLGEDTYAQPERFFSFRRATHAGESDYGRQISLIGLPG